MRIDRIEPGFAYVIKGWTANIRGRGWFLYVRKIENGMVDYCILKNYEWDNLQNKVPGYYRSKEITIQEFANKVSKKLDKTMTFFWFVLEWFSNLEHTVDRPYVSYPEDDQEYILAAFKTFSESVSQENGLRFTREYYKKEFI